MMSTEKKRALYKSMMESVSKIVKKRLAVNENFMSKEDVAAGAYNDILEEEGYQYLDGLVEQISGIFEYDNLGEFEDDVHDAIIDAVCSLTSKYKVRKR